MPFQQESDKHLITNQVNLELCSWAGVQATQKDLAIQYIRREMNLDYKLISFIWLMKSYQRSYSKQIIYYFNKRAEISMWNQL